jgi:protein SCO1
MRTRSGHADHKGHGGLTTKITKNTKCLFLRVLCVLCGLTVFVFFVAGCSSAPAPKTYELKGQILGVKPEDKELLVKHEDIKGFMPAMTMPYKVKDEALLKGKQPGDLITATLEVNETQGFLTSITTTGHAALDVPPAAETVQPIEVVTPGKEVPNELFVDQDAKAVAFSQFKGHRVALTFMYTKCPMPDFCPLMDRNFATVQNTLKKAPEMSDVRLISVSFDPKNDKPAVLKKHAERLKADPAVWSFLTGDEEVISKFAAQFGLSVVFDEKDPTNINHTLRTVVIDPDGKLVKTLTGNSWTPSELIADLKAVPPPAH